MKRLIGIFLFYWLCPYCKHQNSDTSDKLKIHCQKCDRTTTFSNPDVIVTSQWELHESEDERFRIWSEK